MMTERLSPWNEVLGPFFDDAGLRRWKSLTDEALVQLLEIGAVFYVTTADGTRLFPKFQFDDEGQPLPHLAEIWPLLRTAYGEWDAASWLNIPMPDEDRRRTAAEVLRTGDPTEIAEVLTQARRDLNRMRS